jgi:hypothetical protein
VRGLNHRLVVIPEDRHAPPLRLPRLRQPAYQLCRPIAALL